MLFGKARFLFHMLKFAKDPTNTPEVFRLMDTLRQAATPDEVRAFLADTSPNKRDAWIEALLGRPEFVDYWTYKWCDLLLVNSSRLPRVSISMAASDAASRC